MIIRTTYLLFSLFFLGVFSVPSVGQAEGRQSNPTERNSQAVAISSDVATEIAQLRKAVLSLNANLRDIAEKLLAPDAKPDDDTKDRRSRILLNLDLLTRVEQRAEVLRKQLLELIEKETAYKSRLAQFDEDMRPENIERALSGVGTTRTVELRDTRRRVLENDRRGLESLLNQTTQSRTRLEEDVKQADMLVTRLRLKLFPIIEREIEKINPPN